MAAILDLVAVINIARRHSQFSLAALSKVRWSNLPAANHNVDIPTATKGYDSTRIVAQILPLVRMDIYTRLQ